MGHGARLKQKKAHLSVSLFDTACDAHQESNRKPNICLVWFFSVVIQRTISNSTPLALRN